MYGKSCMNNSLQSDLDYLSKWQNIWLLKFNMKDNKCKVMHVGTNNPRNKYYLDDKELLKIANEKDPGVLVSGNSTWRPHIDIVNKVNSCVTLHLVPTVSKFR